jgi:leucyl aminopeptidase
MTAPTPPTTASPHDRRARDRAAEITAAVRAVVDGDGPVSITGTTAGDGTPTVRFVPATDLPQPGSAWTAPARQAADTVAVGADLYVSLGAGVVDAETARRAGAAAGALLPAGPVRIELPTGFTHPVAAFDGLVTACRATGVDLHVAPELVGAAGVGLLAADIGRLAALLVGAPANLLDPAAAAALATDIAGRTGLGCNVLGPDQVREQGFGALAAIGGGSARGPHLVQLTYRGPDPDERSIALVGKGITFDSGGLSLKSPAAMQSMRLDVAGAATVLAVMAGLRRAGVAGTVRAVLPFAENLPGPGAARPGDVVTSWNGTQIQILDTDFEGRVVLADALALAAADNPDLIVDLATLTYQAEIALGPEIAALLARDDAAAAEVLAAADRAGEPMWRLPLATRYVDQVRTPFGIRNHPLHDSGRAITAALFLAEFVPEDMPWVHVDFTGPAWIGNASVDGATGFGARTLLELLGAADRR